MIEVKDIHVYYGDSYILQGVSLDVRAGEIVCLLGRNGAGKTTTMRGIMGYTPPARGEVWFNKKNITGCPVYDNVRQGLGFVTEDRRIFEVFPLLTKLKDHKGGALSGGEQQMLSLARALMGNPRKLHTRNSSQKEHHDRDCCIRGPAYHIGKHPDHEH